MSKAMNDITRSNSRADLRERLKTEHAAIVDSLKNSLSHAMAAGDMLLEARARLKHGQWLPWIESCDLSERTAQRYMRLARNRAVIEAKSDTVSDLGIKGALAMLAVSRESEDPTVLLADNASDLAFDWWDVFDEAARERKKAREVKEAIIAEALTIMNKVLQLSKQRPALSIWDDDEEEADLIEAALEEYKETHAAEIGVSRDDYDQMQAECGALEDAGTPEADRAYLVYQKFEHAFGESGPLQPAITAARKIRDTAAAFLQRAENAVA
jgi:hypothetical protein